MRTVSAAGPSFLSSRHLSLAERLHHAAVLFRIPKRVLSFLSPSAAAALPLFCLQIFLARRSSDPPNARGVCRCSIGWQREKRKSRKWQKRRESERTRSKGRRKEEREHRRRRRKKSARQTNARGNVFIRKSHRWEGAGGCDWKDKSLHSQNMSYTGTVKHEGAVKINPDCQRWQQEI